jgi:hypothetical protein
MMKQTVIAFIFLCICGLSGVPTNEASGQTTGEHAATSSAEECDVFQPVRAALIQRTRVPLRLPNLCLAYGESAKTLYAILEDADPSGYEIQIAETKDCPGGNYCHVGTVRGSTSPLVENDGVRVPVSLQRGLKGYFVDFSCGAHCDDSSVGWREDGYYYSVSLKGEKKKTMVSVANSAITR